MNTLNTLTGSLRSAQNTGAEALLQMSGAGNGSMRDSAFAGLLKNFDSLGANDAGAKPTESTPSPADPTPAKPEQVKPAETQRLQSQATDQAGATAAPQDAADNETADAQTTAQAASAEQTAKPTEAKGDVKDSASQAKSAAADEKSATTADTPQAKRSRKLLGDLGGTGTTAQAGTQDKTTNPAATTGGVTAKPSKVGAEVCELPAGTDPAAKSAAGQSAVAQTQGRATERAQDQQVTDRGQQLQAQLSDLGDAQNLQAVAAQSFASELKSVLPAQGGGRTAGIEGLASATQAGAASPVAAGNDDNAAAPVSVSVTAPLDDAGFASELGARLTVLAQDGVQHAELHLNPADMGPVAVNIKLDGQQAQVTFHAAQADTRSVLEQGLPDLAAALAGAGLTLAGGGVFQQSQGGRERDGSQAQASGSDASLQGIDATVEGTAAQPLRVAQPRGVVDLYA